jgi:hypothetical protein
MTTVTRDDEGSPSGMLTRNRVPSGVTSYTTFLAPVGPFRELGMEQLDGHGSVEPRVTSRVDFAHSADSDQRANLVRAEPRSSRHSHIACRRHRLPMEFPGAFQRFVASGPYLTPMGA